MENKWENDPKIMTQNPIPGKCRDIFHLISACLPIQLMECYQYADMDAYSDSKSEFSKCC